MYKTTQTWYKETKCTQWYTKNIDQFHYMQCVQIRNVHKIWALKTAGNGKPGCTNNCCLCGGGQGAVDYHHIYDCKQCTGPASSSICARCLLNGERCDQWELVTWTVSIWIVVILSPLYRPSFHSWIAERRTVISPYFIWDPMYVVVCTTEACNKVLLLLLLLLSLLSLLSSSSSSSPSSSLSSLSLSLLL